MTPADPNDRALAVLFKLLSDKAVGRSAERKEGKDLRGLCRTKQKVSDTEDRRARPDRKDAQFVRIVQKDSEIDFNEFYIKKEDSEHGTGKGGRWSIWVAFPVQLYFHRCLTGCTKTKLSNLVKAAEREKESFGREIKCENGKFGSKRTTVFTLGKTVENPGDHRQVGNTQF